MRFNIKKTLLVPTVIIILAFLTVSAIYIINDRLFYSLTGGQGSIDSGTKFGVAIGSLGIDAIDHLKLSKFRLIDVECDKSNSLEKCMYYLRDEDIKSGIINIDTQNGIVKSISWNYTIAL